MGRDGDVAALTSSGFTLVKDPQPRKLVNPGNVILLTGNSTGEIISAVSKGNAISFNHEITDALPTDATMWISFPTANSQFTFTSLVPGKQYWVRVAAIGYRGQMLYSNTGTQIARL